MVQVDEDILEKKGIELFRELLRVYPVAEIDDYIKNGMWKEEIMRTDLVLITAHRREAGAPDPMPLEEVKVPELPQNSVAPQSIGTPPQTSPGKPLSIRPVANPVATPAKAANGVAGAAAPASAPNGPLAELRIIALFVGKWRLDATKTKLLLSKLTPLQRRHVITTFKTTVHSNPDTTADLEQYVEQCEKTDSWDSAQATTTPVSEPAAGTPPALTPGVTSPARRMPPATAPTGGNAVPVGLKRPLGVVSPPDGAAMDPSRRPRIVGALVPPRAGASPSPPAGPPGLAVMAETRPPRPPMPNIRPAAPQRPATMGLRPTLPGPAAAGTSPQAGGAGVTTNLLQRF